MKVGDAVQHIYDIANDFMVVGLVVEMKHQEARIQWASKTHSPAHMCWYKKHLLKVISSVQ
jgi:hypothetical protein